MHLASSDVAGSNTVLSCLGTNFKTAFRMFCAAFQEKTSVAWDDRFVAFTEGSQHLHNIEKMKFDQRPFIYHLPAYGPTGYVEPILASEPNYALTTSQSQDSFDQGSSMEVDGQDFTNGTLNLGTSCLGQRFESTPRDAVQA